MLRRTTIIALLAAGALAVAGIAYSAGGDMNQAESAEWDCNPKVLIIGYYHCAPPGKASVLDIVTGNKSPSSVEFRVFHPSGEFAGMESLLRADLYRGQPCPQDGLAAWGLLDLPVDYYACHRFETGA